MCRRQPRRTVTASRSLRSRRGGQVTAFGLIGVKGSRAGQRQVTASTVIPARDSVTCQTTLKVSKHPGRR